MSGAGEVQFGDGGVSRHVYPSSAMVGDYLRAAAGLVPCGILLLATPVAEEAVVVLGGFAAVFGLFGARTLLRHGTRFEMSDSELRAIGARRTVIRWDGLDRIKLAYYSTRRDRRSGWMQLELRAGPARVKLDSRIEGFADVVERAAEAAAERGLELTDATAANLEALNVRRIREGMQG